MGETATDDQGEKATAEPESAEIQEAGPTDPLTARPVDSGLGASVEEVPAADVADRKEVSASAGEGGEPAHSAEVATDDEAAKDAEPIPDPYMEDAGALNNVEVTEDSPGDVTPTEDAAASKGSTEVRTTAEAENEFAPFEARNEDEDEASPDDAALTNCRHDVAESVTDETEHQAAEASAL